MIVTTINYVGIQPSGIVIDDNGKYAYNTNYNTLYAGPDFTNLTPGQGTVNVIDLCKNKIIDTIQVNQGPANIVLDNNTLYVSNFISNTVNFINLPC
jgi:DNA-binding beta-propeller fold protein YncE